MIISLKWLKEYIDLDDISTDEIVDKLTTSGSEVEEVIDKVKEFENIVVGKVETVKKHPNADRLSVCEVNDGTETFSVVCGAPNVAAGQLVPFAKVGAIIPNGKFEIKKATIRGEKSSGMICAEDELALSNDHSGIMVLDENLTIGQPLSTALKLDDVILDIAITPNRADSLSHIGLARDLAAIFNRKVKYPKIKSKFVKVDKNEFAEVIIENTSACPRYTAVVLKGIEVKESPVWLKDKLINIGLRPINNIVDVTNFILHEIGQPLHAFDLNHLTGRKIVVKNNNRETKFTTLDSKERSMLPSDLMICDGEKPVAIAGVMGGENSEVTAKTKDILIESAYFNPSNVRKTAKHLGLSSDSSYRFERGTDPNGTLFAAIRAAELMQQIAGGEIINDIIDIYPNEIEKRTVPIRFSRINQILGFNIESDEVERILSGLEFLIETKNSKQLSISVPTFRHDIEREIDLIEEVVRIYGFDGVPEIDKISIPLKSKIDQTEFNNTLRNYLITLGFNEVISNSLISDEKTIDYDHSIKVINPQSKEMTNLRTSLIPGLLMNISRNLRVKENSLRFFEIGQTFSLINNKIDSFEDFDEKENLIIAISGIKQTSEWYQKETKFDYFDLSGVLSNLIDNFRLQDRVTNVFVEEQNDIFDFSVKTMINDNALIIGGKVSSKLLDSFEISDEVFLYEINLDLMKHSIDNNRKFQPLLKYPKVYRDFGFILDKKISYNEVVNTIKESSTKLLKNVNLFDIFESESLGSGKKSLAFQLEYYDETKTLREEEIDKEFWNTIETVKTKLKAELRG